MRIYIMSNYRKRRKQQNNHQGPNKNMNAILRKNQFLSMKIKVKADNSYKKQ